MANVLLRCAHEPLNEVSSKKFTNFVTLAELGGVKWHLLRDTIEELFEQLEFVGDHNGVKSVVLLSHTDCSLYQELGEDDYQADLEEAAGQISQHFPDLSVMSYLYHVDSKELEQISGE